MGVSSSLAAWSSAFGVVVLAAASPAMAHHRQYTPALYRLLGQRPVVVIAAPHAPALSIASSGENHPASVREVRYIHDTVGASTGRTRFWRAEHGSADAARVIYRFGNTAASIEEGVLVALSQELDDLRASQPHVDRDRVLRGKVAAAMRTGVTDQDWQGNAIHPGLRTVVYEAMQEAVDRAHAQARVTAVE